jgi:hypothetical protein
MATSMLTIAFRGLMLFRQQGSGAGSFFEIGILQATDHILRINTVKNGILDSVLVAQDLQPGHRIWRLEVDKPTDSGVSTETQGVTFDRKSHTFERDFRWLINLDDNTEFYGQLAGKINTALLSPVLRIPHGKFYTRLKSHALKRTMDGVSGEENPFGFIAAAIACDIEVTGGAARLVLDDPPHVQVADFEVDPSGNTLYEIVNTPPDPHMMMPGMDEDHFQFYYNMFTVNVPKFHFQERAQDTAPAPSPALCGGAGLGQFPNQL